MKKLILIISTSLMLVACGSGDEPNVEEVIASGDLEQIRALKQEISKKQAKYAEQVKLLDAKIEELESN